MPTAGITGIITKLVLCLSMQPSGQDGLGGAAVTQEMLGSYHITLVASICRGISGLLELDASTAWSKTLNMLCSPCISAAVIEPVSSDPQMTHRGPSLSHWQTPFLCVHRRKGRYVLAHTCTYTHEDTCHTRPLPPDFPRSHPCGSPPASVHMEGLLVASHCSMCPAGVHF